MTDAGAIGAAPDATGAPSTGSGGRLGHVPAFDGFRGLGSIVVLAGHSGWITGSWLAVDMFFVLSGYLITSLLLIEQRNSTARRIDLRRFWARRVRRLGPALILTLIGVAAYAAFVAPERQRRSILGDGLATLFEVMNWRMIATGDDYWSSFGPASPLKHAWSLSIEEQLYILWPLLVVGLLAWKRKPLAVAIGSLVVAAASTTVMLVLERRGASIGRLYQGTDVRATSMAVGAAVAGFRLHLGPRRWRATRDVRIIVGTMSAVALGWLWIFLDAEARSTYRGWLPLAGILAAIVIASIADPGRGGPVGRLFDIPVFVWLGTLSYGLYLFHWPIFLWLDEERTGMDGAALFILRSSISIFLAWLSYRFVEHPIRRGAITGRRALAAVPASMAVAIIALVAGTWGAAPAPSSDWDSYLVTSTDPGAPTIVMAGDSVPLLLAHELVNQVDELGVNVGSVAVEGCHLMWQDGPIRDPEGRIRGDTTCGGPDRFREGAEAYDPDVAVLLFGRLQNDAVQIDGTWRMPCEPEYEDAYRARVMQAIEDLSVTGADVVLVSGPGSSVSWVVEASPPGMFERIACTNDLLREIAEDEPGVGFVDLDAWICPEPGRCLDEIDGIDLRPDTSHFEGPSAALVNRWLIPRVLEAAEDA